MSISQYLFRMYREIIAIITIGTIIVITSCSAGNAGSEYKKTGDRPVRTVSDDLGRSVTVPVRIERVVSLAPSVTENVFAAGAGDRLVGVTTFCNYPEEARSIAKVGDTMNPNMETIVALKPDVVLVSTASQIESFTNTLDQNGIAVYVTDPASVFDVFRDLLRLGELFGTTENANVIVRSLEERAAAVERGVKDTPKPKVFVQISKEPLFTIGRGSFLNGLLDVLNATSVTADVETAFPKLSKETASVLNPDAIVLSDSADNKEPNDVFKNSAAVKNGRVYHVNADILSRPGPRLIDALEELAKDLHPEQSRNP